MKTSLVIIMCAGYTFRQLFLLTSTTTWCSQNFLKALVKPRILSQLMRVLLLRVTHYFFRHIGQVLLDYLFLLRVIIIAVVCIDRCTHILKPLQYKFHVRDSKLIQSTQREREREKDRERDTEMEKEREKERGRE